MLPPIIEQLVGIIGIECVQLLVEARLLGYRQRIGRSRECEWWREWADVIGDGPTDAAMRVWAGQEIYFPACADAVRAERNRQIVLRFERLTRVEGLSATRAVRRLCRDFRLSDRTIDGIINAPQQDASELEKQLGLF